MTDPTGKLGTDVLLAAVELMGRTGPRGRVRVRGESMRPTLTAGQELEIEFQPSRPSRGDMLVFRQGRDLLVHRCLGPARAVPGCESGFRTRGDGVPELDPTLNRQDVVGRVIAFADGKRWCSTRDRPARVYAWMVAWHARFWGAVAAGLRVADRRTPWSLRPLAVAADRGLLGLTHGLLFRLVHAHRAEAPRGDG